MKKGVDICLPCIPCERTFVKCVILISVIGLLVCNIYVKIISLKYSHVPFVIKISSTKVLYGLTLIYMKPN